MMSSTSSQIAYELHRKPKLDPEDRYAWENVEIQPMDQKKVLGYQQKIQKRPMDVGKVLQGISSKHVRARIDRSADQFTAMEGSSGLICRIVFIEVHRKTKMVKRNSLREDAVYFTDSVDLLLEKVPGPTTASFQVFNTSSKSPLSMDSTFFESLRFPPVAQVVEKPEPTPVAAKTEEQPPVTPKTSKAPKPPKTSIPSKTTKPPKKVKWSKKKALQDSSDSSDNDTVFDEDSSSSETPITQPSSTEKKNGRGRYMDRDKEPRSRKGSPPGRRPRKVTGKPVVKQYPEPETLGQGMQEMITKTLDEREEAKSKKDMEEKIRRLELELENERRRDPSGGRRRGYDEEYGRSDRRRGDSRSYYS